MVKSIERVIELRKGEQVSCLCRPIVDSIVKFFFGGLMPDTLNEWAKSLSEVEAQVLLIEAAKQHKAKFTSPHSIGVNWAVNLRRQGFHALPPYARDFMAKMYLEHCEALQA